MKTIQLLYIGKRLLNDKLVCSFQKVGTDKGYYFKKPRYCQIGHLYEASLDDDSVSIPIFPKDLGEGEYSQQDYDSWVGEEAAAEAFIKRKRAADKIKRDPEITKDLSDHLKRYCSKLDYYEQKALVEEVMRQLLKFK